MDGHSADHQGGVAPLRPLRTEDLDHVIEVEPPKQNVTTRILASGSQQQRIRKRTSAAHMRAASQTTSPRTPSTTSKSLPFAEATAVDSATSQQNVRKGSLRNVVRRIFGRKPRLFEEPPRPTSSRHGYHKSDPGAMLSIQERRQQELPMTAQPRVVSSPLQLRETPSFPKMRSPNAVEFPQSARLKPLDLGNPFHKPPPQTLKRRATLPSLVLDDHDAATLAKFVQFRSTDNTPAVPELPRQDSLDIGVALTCAGSSLNRRSRSADDSRLSQALQPPRDRNEEIKYWRESYNGSVLRHSAAISALSEHAELNEPTSSAQVSPAQSRSMSQIPNETEFIKPRRMHDSPIMSSRPVTAGGNTTSELEARVNRLEEELSSFEATVHCFTNSIPRQKISLDTSSPPQQTSTHNSPSVLVSDLQNHDSKALRNDSTPPRTFSALYNIISSERSARRVLENQVRSLKDDLSEVKYQLSQPIITRDSSAYMAPPQRQQHRIQSQQYRAEQQLDQNQSGPGASGQQRNTTISRFSLTDSVASSEAGRMRDSECRDLGMGRLSRDEDDNDEMVTPHEMYQTPTAEAIPRGWSRDVQGDDMMF